MYGAGAGADTIINAGGGTDWLIFQDNISQDRLSFLQSGEDLIIRVDQNQGSQVTVQGWFNGAEHQLSYIQPAGGSALSAALYAPQWRAARWGAGVLVVAHLVGLNAWAWQERQALTAKQASVRNTLTQTFPKVQVVVDAPVQMERELAQLRQAAGSVSARDLEPLLAAAGAALPDGRLPSSIEYTPGELRLRGVTLAPDEESVVSGRLQAAGYRARMDDGSLLLRTEVSP